MKIKELYNLPSFDALPKCAKKPGFTDSYAGVVLERNLTQVDPRIFEKRFPGLAFLASGIEANNAGGFSRRIQSLRLQETGGFTTSGDRSTNKGQIGLRAEDNDLKVFERETHAKWSDSDAKEAEMQNINLVNRFLDATNRIYQREIDEIGLRGKADGPATGLLDFAWTSNTAANTAENLTAEQLYGEISELITDQWNDVQNTDEYRADKVIMPIDVLNHATQEILNSAAGPMTVLQALKANWPGIEFLGSFRAENVGGSSATVAFSSSPEAMVFRLPVPLTVGEIVKISSFDLQVDAKYRCAGLDVLESTAARKLTGL